ncbi:hypothetical protein [Oscillatoria sp. FACHB-1406]|uniref:hypothetical protein n=1 Tax=Oscillatoria sp. FACHB-1406 TaxID=2692846 RepID=UPI001688B891|nr:hypothetical protein [Oscillatoria sp. FACHB-1406]MBD2578620.1 hypothetical protein [Oscillatoria sp. FACHB-1406]
MNLKTIRKWLIVGAAEVLLSLVLLSVAPIFLNSNKPAIGFAIWLAVPSLLGSSGLYVGLRAADAKKARTLFLKRFPEYDAIALAEFLDISSQQVLESLEMLDVLQSDPDFQALHLTPMELLKGIKKR